MQKVDQQRKGGDDVLDGRLYECHASAIYRYIFRQVSHAQDAEDLLLDVFLIALQYENLQALPAQEQLAWLQGVARRRIIDRYRRTSSVALLPLEQVQEMFANELSPEEHALQQESRARLYASLAELPPLQQQLLRLRYGNGLRFTEIATILNKPEGTVRKMAVRVLRRLRVIYNHR